MSTAALAAGLLAWTPAAVSATPQACAGTASPMSRIGNSVFDDANNNASFDSGESGIDGVTVELWLDLDDDANFEPNGDDGVAPSCTVLTSAGGSYWFYDVDPEQYFVAVPSAPVGYRSSTGSNGTVATDNVDDGGPAAGYASVSVLLDLTTTLAIGEVAPDGSDDEARADIATAPASFPDGDSDLTVDFGFTPVPCLGVGNRVWLDSNLNGRHDPAEPGIDDVTIQLFTADASGSPEGATLETLTTSDGGYYLFSCRDEDDYVVVVPASNFATGAALDGLMSTTDGIAATDLQDDGLDPAMAGNRVISRTTTLLSGGQAVVEPNKPSGTAWSFDAPTDAANTTTVDFGFVALTPADPAISSIGDYVWVDADRDGVQGPDETPVAGVTLVLRSGEGIEIATSTTDGDGRYGFAGLTAGTYSVCYVPATLPPGLVATVNDTGSNDDTDSDFDATTCSEPAALTASTQVVTLDLGLVSSNVDVAITKAGTWLELSDHLSWSIAVRNLGTQADPGSIIVTDILPAGLGTPTITPPSGMTCNYDTSTRAITCTSTAPLPAGASLAISVVTPRTNTDLCSISNTATVRGTAVDATTANNVATTTVNVGCASNNSPTLPVTGGTVFLVSLAAILALSGYQFLRLSDHHPS